MISKTTRQFWKLFKKLPISIQFRAVLSYKNGETTLTKKNYSLKELSKKYLFIPFGLDTVGGQ